MTINNTQGHFFFSLPLFPANYNFSIDFTMIFVQFFRKSCNFPALILLSDFPDYFYKTGCEERKAIV